ncbi:MAG: hypothetical protein IH944_06915 [Armatimonadetes bacterium]|nr:hypothetical protein [Armatimonadota bacterium]
MLTALLLPVALSLSGPSISVLQDQQANGVHLAVYDLMTGELISESVELPIKEPGAVRTLTVSPDGHTAVVTQSTSAFDPPIRLVAFDVKEGRHIMTDLVDVIVGFTDFVWSSNTSVRWMRHDLYPDADEIRAIYHSVFKDKNGQWASSGRILNTAERQTQERRALLVATAARMAWDMDWQYHVGESSGITPFSPEIYGMDGLHRGTGAMADAGQTFACFDSNMAIEPKKASVNTYWSGREKKITLEIGDMIAVHMELQSPFIVITLADRDDYVVTRYEMGYRYVTDMRATKVQVYSLETGEKVFELAGSAAFIK